MAENTNTKVLDIVRMHSVHSQSYMASKVYKRQDVIEMLKRQQGKRSLRQFARDLNISSSHLSDIYLGNRNPGEVILEQLGLVKRIQTTVLYEKVS